MGGLFDFISNISMNILQAIFYMVASLCCLKYLRDNKDE